MFCPKCGTENPEANKYCRTCRENLQLVSQAMKKRLPVMIVSKLDAALERLSERYRRDSILFLVFSVWAPIATAIIAASKNPSTRPVGLFLGALGFLIGLLLSLWSYLAYKRSLTLGERLESGDFVTGSTTSRTAHSLGIQTVDLSDSRREPLSQPELQIRFCPTCGAKTRETLKHCRACGADLQALRTAVKPNWWRRALNYQLDRYIKSTSSKSKIRHRAAARFFPAFFFLCWGMLPIFQGKIPLHFFPLFLFPGFVFLVMAGWDYVASRRWVAQEEAVSDKAQMQTSSGGEQMAATNAPTTNELSLPSAQLPLSVTETTTRKLEPVVKDDAATMR